uniref:DNA topoisomerase I DNA binding eukaryotic-type domain-containing protein n=1 Tax=Erpetoichthys calabaricus TaxID=27687 RepID=A0A8C4SRH4_ERPCA
MFVKVYYCQEFLSNAYPFSLPGQPVALSLEAEEVAGFFAHMLNHEYTTKEIFRCNFFNDWRKVMTEDEKMKIADLNKCDFTEMANYFTAKTEARKNCSKEEKQVLSESCHPRVTNVSIFTWKDYRRKGADFITQMPISHQGHPPSI